MRQHIRTLNPDLRGKLPCLSSKQHCTPRPMSSRIFLTAFGILALGVAVQAWWPWPFPWPPFSPFPHPHTPTQPVSFACYGGGGDCNCPADLTGASGVLINVYPGYQCAYPAGACTWDDKTGALQNTLQTNCPSSAPCSTVSGCSCPADLNDDAGVMINQFTGYQCAYPKGACTWDYLGNLTNTAQTNCPSYAKCAQLASDS